MQEFKTIPMEQFTYQTPAPITCPLCEYSMAHCSGRSTRRDRGKGRRRVEENPHNIPPFTPLILCNSSDDYYPSYQDALLAAAQEAADSTDPSISNIVNIFSRLHFYDPGSKCYKIPYPTSESHILFIISHSEYFSSKFTIDNEKIYRK